METRIVFNTPHPAQQYIYDNAGQFNAVRCGRRFGKTELLIMLTDITLQGKFVGVFAPTFKLLTNIYDACEEIYQPLIAQANKLERRIRLTTGGVLEFWHLNNNPRAGRSRKYHRVLIDEGAFMEGLEDIFEKAIVPTLLDYDGDAWVFSTPNGEKDPKTGDYSYFYKICHDEDEYDRKGNITKKKKWHSFKAPSSANPAISAEALARIKSETHPLIFLQEYEAEFANFNGVRFFDPENLLVDGQPVDPVGIETIYAVMDTAYRGGESNDGSGVVYFGATNIRQRKLYILDWDYRNIDGALLDAWIPEIFARMKELQFQHGSVKEEQILYIEDKGTGVVLLQKAEMAGFLVAPLPQEWTQLGKDARAMAVASAVYANRVLFTPVAYNKTTYFQNRNLNHLHAQVESYRVNQPQNHDDLLDCFTYGIKLALN